MTGGPLQAETTYCKELVKTDPGLVGTKVLEYIKPVLEAEDQLQLLRISTTTIVCFSLTALLIRWFANPDCMPSRRGLRSH